MPYILSKPPKRIKKLPTQAIAIWIATFNSAWKQYHKDEKKANAVAWAAVKVKFQKIADKWVARKAAKKEMPIIKGMEFPVFIGNFKFAEGKPLTEIKIMPFGTREHSEYGTIKTEGKEIEEYIKNFNSGVRKELPITEGHSVEQEEKPAIGWFKKLVDKGREGLWAVVEWTEKGKEVLKAKAYKYFSPEFFTTYEDPETHKKYSNVLSGGALTNRPYFKEQEGVAVFSELMLDNKMTIEEILAKEVEALTDEEKDFLKEHKEDLTDEQKEEYKGILVEPNDEPKDKPKDELKDKPKDEPKDKPKDKPKEEPKDKPDVASEKVIQMSETALKMLERNAQEGVKAMTELKKQKAEGYVQAMTFSEHNQSGPLLPKASKGVADFLLSLNESQQKVFKEIMKGLPKARLFSELGKDSGVPVKASERFQLLVDEKMKANDKLLLRQAYEIVAAENPEIAENLE